MATSHTLELALRHPIIYLSILTFIILLTRSWPPSPPARSAGHRFCRKPTGSSTSILWHWSRALPWPGQIGCSRPGYNSLCLGTSREATHRSSGNGWCSCGISWTLLPNGNSQGSPYFLDMITILSGVSLLLTFTVH